MAASQQTTHVAIDSEFMETQAKSVGDPRDPHFRVIWRVQASTNRVGVYVCGPKLISYAAEAFCYAKRADGYDTYFHRETFDL